MKNNELLREDEKEEWGGWKFVSDMLDSPDKGGIYPTSKCYKQLYDFVVEQKKKARNSLKAELVEELKKLEDTSGIFSDPWRNGMKEGRNSTLDEAIELVKKI